MAPSSINASYPEIIARADGRKFWRASRALGGAISDGTWAPAGRSEERRVGKECRN